MAFFWLLIEVVFVLLSAFVIQKLVAWLIHKRHIIKLFSSHSIAGPPPSYWTGNYREFLRSLPHISLDRWSRQYGPVYGYYQGEAPMLVLSDLNDIQEVLVKFGRKQFVNRQKPIINVDPFSGSLLNVRGDVWKNSRRVLTPSFTAHKVTLQTTRTTIQQTVESLLKSIDTLQAKDGLVDLHDQMKRVTLGIILRLAFDMNDSDVFDKNNKFVHMIHEFMDQNSNTINEMAGYFPFMTKVLAFAYNNFSNGRMITEIREQLDKSFVKYYQSKIATHFKAQDGNKSDDNDEESSKKEKVNLLDFMLNEQQKGNLSELQVMGNALVILLAGFETTANALTFTMYELAKNQDIQRKLRDELRELYGDHYDAADMNEMSKVRCELMDRVWYESLRLYPPVVTFVTRELDDQLTNVELSSGVNITNEMIVQIPVWTVQHNPDYWPEPNRFNPFRASLPLPGHKDQPKTGMFMAFGAGPRNCIGANLALSEARTVIASLLLQYSSIELADEDKGESLIDPETGLLYLQCPTVIIQPAKQIRIKFTK